MHDRAIEEATTSAAAATAETHAKVAAIMAAADGVRAEATRQAEDALAQARADAVQIQALATLEAAARPPRSTVSGQAIEVAERAAAVAAAETHTGMRRAPREARGLANCCARDSPMQPGKRF